MEAGILSYLLCDREFDCARCPLDEAMRSHYSPARKENPGSIGTPHDGARGDLREPGVPRTGVTADHVGVTARGDGTLRIFLEETAAATLPPLKSVVMPVPGRKIAAGSPCCWLIFEGGTIPIRIPFQGMVERVNRELTVHPHLAADDPAAAGWLFDVTPADMAGACETLLTPGEADALNFGDGEIYRRLIAECIQPAGAPAGKTGTSGVRTMQDGGHPVGDLPEIIGPVKYLEIVRRAFWGKR